MLGASAGGVQALPKLIRSLPADFPAAVFVVLPTTSIRPGLLPEIIQRTSALPVRHGVDGEKIIPRHVYVARPDHHLMIDGPRIRSSIQLFDVAFPAAAGSPIILDKTPVFTYEKAQPL